MTRITSPDTAWIGASTAANLRDSGAEGTVWKRMVAKAQPPAEPSAKLADTPAAAVVGANAAITMPSDGPVVDDLLEAQGGADALFGGAPVVDCVAIPTATACRSAERVGARDVDDLDTPVSGAPRAAESASLGDHGCRPRRRISAAANGS